MVVFSFKNILFLLYIGNIRIFEESLHQGRENDIEGLDGSLGFFNLLHICQTFLTVRKEKQHKITN